MLFNKAWWKAALVRAVRTIAQTAVGSIAVGAALHEIDWLRVLSVAVVAGLLSVLTSLAGLPEVEGEQEKQDEAEQKKAEMEAVDRIQRILRDADDAPKELKFVFPNTVDDPKPEQEDGESK